jgi:uncharacterized protein YndB with AHSA1/START domain
MPDVLIHAPSGLPEVVVTTELDAPRSLVFRAHTDPGLLARWLGPHGLTTHVDRYEARDGGRWRFVQRDDEGHELGFHGVFHGDPTPESTVRTFESESAPGHVSLELLELEELDERTYLRATSVFRTVGDRDAMLRAGMERGVREGYDRLQRLLDQLKQSDHDELEDEGRAAA